MIKLKSNLVIHVLLLLRLNLKMKFNSCSNILVIYKYELAKLILKSLDIFICLLH